MKSEIIRSVTRPKVIVRKCHVCGEIIESPKEVERCVSCSKSFLPLNYFSKVHAKNTDEYKQLFENAEDLVEEDLIKGLFAIW